MVRNNVDSDLRGTQVLDVSLIGVILHKVPGLVNRFGSRCEEKIELKFPVSESD
jgi:hypothetical protein